MITELDKVFVWLASNKLTLNVKKSKFMLVTNKLNIPDFCVKINDSPLEICKSYKYLGVVIDDKLKWDAHIKYISTKISKACGALARLRNCTDIEILKNVYHALIHSYLRYWILIWGNSSKTMRNPLQTQLNKAVRIIVSAPFGNIDLQPAYDYLGILDVSKLYMLETAKYHFKFVNDLLPTQIGNYFTTQSVTHTHGLRSRSSNKPPRFVSKSRIGERSIQYKGSQIWKAMPIDLKNCETFPKFKTAYKKYLLENEINATIFLNETDLLLHS